MATRVFLHIGAPKSGTTYLQTVMWNNREALRSQGLLYPGRRRMDHHNATLTVRGVRGGQTAPDESGPGERDAWDRLTGEIRSWDGNAILSHEFYCAATGEQASWAVEQLAPADVHVVYTVRDYVRSVPAYWQEALKMRYPHGLGEYTRAALADELTGPWSWLTLDAVSALERWSGAVPADHVHVVTVPPPGAPPTLLWERYAGVLGIDPASCTTAVAKANESLGAAQAELLRRVKPHLHPDLHPLRERYHWVREVLGHQVLVPQGGPRLGVRKDEAEQLRDLSAKAAEQLAAAGYDIVGNLDEIVPTDIPELPHPDDVSDAELVQVSEQAIAALLFRLRKATVRGRRGYGGEAAPPGRPVWRRVAHTARRVVGR